MTSNNSKHDSLTDKELLARIRNCDREAFDTVYGKYHRDLYFYALKLIKDRDDASDIIQDTFVKLWMNSGSIPPEVNLKSYLSVMVRNRVLNYIRDNRARLLNNYRIIRQRGLWEDNPGPDRLDDMVWTKELEEAIGQLPPQQRKVAELRKEGLSNAEIAKRMNLSVNTINVHYRLMLNSLRNKCGHLVSLVILYVLW